MRIIRRIVEGERWRGRALVLSSFILFLVQIVDGYGISNFIYFSRTLDYKPPRGADGLNSVRRFFVLLPSPSPSACPPAWSSSHSCTSTLTSGGNLFSA